MNTESCSPLPFSFRRTALLSLIPLALSFSWTCNDRVITPLDQALSAATGQDISVDAKTKIDILFVIDESPSMKEEQTSLANNFATFSDFIFDDLRNSVDYRIAVTSTGSKVEGSIGAYPNNLGVFVTQSSDTSPQCSVSLPPVISPTNLGCAIEDSACQREALQRTFSCLAQVGIDGIIWEKGLEAMRSSLSCNGPNAGFFGACCVPNADGTRLEYDALCRQINDSRFPPPEFLRPDAILVVVFITDEDDCSLYSDMPIDSPLATCSLNVNTVENALGAGDAAGQQAAANTIFSSYTTHRNCAGLAPQACHALECTNNSGQVLDPVECYFQRCAITMSPDDLTNIRACRYQGNKLAPVSYYHDFLKSLKGRPNDQIIVANIVPTGLLSPNGLRLNFSEVANSNPRCDEVDYLRANIDSCCPEGQCGAVGDIKSCADGYSAWRYIDLMSMFGTSGLGCREGEEQGCVNLCDPNLSAALGALRERVISAVGDYCVARRPACLVTDPMTMEIRPCNLDEEGFPENYQLQLRQVCELSAEENGDCGLVGETNILGLGVDYLLDVNDPSCASGVRVQLTSPPRAGSSTKMDLLQSSVLFDE